MKSKEQKFREAFEFWYWEKCKNANPIPLNNWDFEDFKRVCMNPTGETYNVDSAKDYWYVWELAKAVAKDIEEDD